MATKRDIHPVELIWGFAPSMALYAVLKLGIPDILQANGGSMSLEGIVSKLPCNSPAHAARNLKRILQLLVIEGVFTQSIVSSESDKKPSYVYGLTRWSAPFVGAGPGNLQSTALLQLSRVFLSPWQHMDDFVLDSEKQPFEVANGKDMWTLMKEDQVFHRLFKSSVFNISSLMLNLIVDSYKGLKGVKILVDVGGMNGSTLSAILAANPEIHGINFDLPYVIADAPAIPGVEHVGGDMFESVPNGDAIMMKWILHDWNDEKCVKILQNCHAALSEGGKVILMDHVVGIEEAKNDMKFACTIDLLMMCHTGGQERTLEDWKSLATAAGFGRFELCILQSKKSVSLMELYVQ